MVCRGCGRDLGDTDYCPACDGERRYEGKSIVKKYNLFTAYISMFKNHSDYGGRCRRSEYWLAQLMNFIVLVLIYLTVNFLPFLRFGNFIDKIIYVVVMLSDFFVLIYVYAMIIPIISVTVRRIHDTGRSAWWLVGIATIFIFWLWVPIKFFKALFFLTGMIGGLILTIMDSQVGINKYGPNRKGVE